MALQELAYALLGVLVGIIFILDGWRSSSEIGSALDRSPKIRGLVFVLGAGIIPAVQASLNSEDSGVLALYALSFVASTLVVLAGLATYAFVVAYNQVGDVRPQDRRSRRAVDALPLVVTAIQEGIPAFRQHTESLQLEALLEQRNWAIDFILGFTDRLVHEHAAGSGPDSQRVEAFLSFVERYLETFLLNLFERAAVLERFRAAVYFRPPGSDTLVFLTGVSPRTALHSRMDLPLAGSIAGTALLHPTKVFTYSGKGETPFHKGQVRPRYRGILARAIFPATGTHASDADLVLSIDAVERLPPDPLDYRRRMVYVMGLLLANARTSMGISAAMLQAFLAGLRPAEPAPAAKDQSRLPEA